MSYPQLSFKNALQKPVLILKLKYPKRVNFQRSRFSINSLNYQKMEATKLLRQIEKKKKQRLFEFSLGLETIDQDLVEDELADYMDSIKDESVEELTDILELYA